jgi:hypothetical protein
MLLRKFKSYFIILLILTLSFVPNVNASSDIFDEPHHIDYDTYKGRMIEYIETPDYLKPSMPPIVSRNEYIDFMDIISASEDLLSILPVVNGTFDEIKKTSSYKSLNTVLVETIENANYVHDFSLDRLQNFLTPYIQQPGAINNMEYFIRYHNIAKNIQDIIIDNLNIKNQGIGGTIDWNRKVTINDITYTIEELFNRIATADINADGLFYYNIIEDVDSGSMIPLNVEVDKVADVLNDYVSTKVIKSEQYNFDEGVIMVSEVGIWNRLYNLFRSFDFGNFHLPTGNFRTAENNPILLIDDNNPIVDIIKNDPNTKELIDLNTELRFNPAAGDTEPIDIQPVTIIDKAAEMNIGPDALNDVYLKGVNGEKALVGVSAFETGVFFVLAIVTLVLACVYK